MSNFVLKGHISYAVKRKYRWVAEFGKNTCEKCAALHGQEFDEDEVPYWPHLNCLEIQAFAKTQRFRSQGAFLSVSPA